MKTSFAKTAIWSLARLWLATILIITACSDSNDGDDSGGYNGYGSMTDSGGKTYKTVEIGTQTWMVENLNYDVSGSKCYKDTPANCSKYGRLYNWETAMTVCPSGWRLPTEEEWNTLTDFVESENGCSDCAGRYLKAKNGWDSNNGLDTYGFAALPGGYRYSLDDSFFGAGSFGNWWSASEDYDEAYVHSMGYYFEGAGGFADKLKTYLFSVRCIKDYSDSSGGGADSDACDGPSCRVEQYPYCYGYYNDNNGFNYRDCNLIGGKWITDKEHCFSGGGQLVNANYCYENGILIDDTP